MQFSTTAIALFSLAVSVSALPRPWDLVPASNPPGVVTKSSAEAAPDNYVAPAPGPAEWMPVPAANPW